jgi:hypothetical protein
MAKTTKKMIKMLSDWNNRLNDLEPLLDCDFRIKEDSKHVHTTIIVGFYYDYDITPRISLSDDGKSLTFEIEKIDTIFRKSVNKDYEKAFESYLLYLNHLLQFEHVQRKRLNAWPELITQDQRVDTIKKVLS